MTDDTSRPAIALIAHPGPDPASCTYLGGEPRLPQALKWPRDPDDTPLTFVGQFALDTLPRSVDGQRLPEFPDAGTLFLFVACADADEIFANHNDPYWSLLYHPGPTDDIAPVAAPEDAPGLATDGLVYNSAPWSRLRPPDQGLFPPPSRYARLPLCPQPVMMQASAEAWEASAPARDRVPYTVWHKSMTVDGKFDRLSTLDLDLWQPGPHWRWLVLGRIA